MIEVTAKLYVWEDLMNLMWGASYAVLKDVEKQKRKNEAWEIITEVEKNEDQGSIK